MSSTFYLQTRGGLYWAGQGWWSRRKDQAKRFTSKEEAERERDAQIVVNVDVSSAHGVVEEPATAE